MTAYGFRVTLFTVVVVSFGVSAQAAWWNDNIIGDFVNITTGCSMGGYVTLEEGVAVNTGANIVPRVTVGAWTVIGAAALVMNDVAGGLVVIGAPAQPLRPAD